MANTNAFFTVQILGLITLFAFGAFLVKYMTNILRDKVYIATIDHLIYIKDYLTAFGIFPI